MALFLAGNVTAGANTGNFTQLRATPIGAPLVNLRISVGTANNIVLQLDSDASGTNTTYQSSILTATPNNWIDLGPIDPSRVWVRAATATTTTVMWAVTW